MIVMDLKYGKQLRNFSGSQLTEKLREVLETIKKERYQRTRDRGCYLILENIGRVPEADQEELLKEMLNANPNPSYGVREKLRRWFMLWKPRQTPSASILAALIEKIPAGCPPWSGAGPFLVWWSYQYGDELPERLFCEIKEILTAKDRPELVAELDSLRPIYNINFKKDI